MKKNSQYIAWLLVSAFALSMPAPVYPIEPKQTLSKEKIGLLKRLVKEYREFRELRRKRKAKNASLEELRKLDQRMTKIRRAAIIAGLAPMFLAMVVGGVAFGISLAKDRSTNESAAKGAVLLTLGGFPMGPLLSGMLLTLRWELQDIKKAFEYRKQAITKHLEPNTEQIIHLKRQLRSMISEGVSADKIAQLIQEIKKLEDENSRIKKSFDLQDSASLTTGATPHNRFILQQILDEYNKKMKEFIQTYNLKTINMILETYNKKITADSPYYQLFVSALNQNAPGIKSRLANGGIYAFEEPWIWPAVTDIFLGLNQKPTAQQIEQLQQKLEWPKWYAYWKGIERSAQRLGLIKENQTIKDMTDAERKNLVEKVKNRLVQEQIEGASRK